jgi:hypothetical protein
LRDIVPESGTELGRVDERYTHMIYLKVDFDQVESERYSILLVLETND